ncbi:hypothetical protein ACIBF1_41285 [Spirillospora sp. NPDC050679]
MSTSEPRSCRPNWPPPWSARWYQMIRSAGGCEQLVRLRGERLTLDGETGGLIESYSTADEPPDT